MQCYETIYILHPELGEEAEQAAKDQVSQIIGQTEGRIYQSENWGKKRLAYEIQKQSRGVYQLIRYIGTAETQTKIERLFRLDEAFLKFLTLRLKTDPASITVEVPEDTAAEPVAAGDAAE